MDMLASPLTKVERHCHSGPDSQAEEEEGEKNSGNFRARLFLLLRFTQHTYATKSESPHVICISTFLPKKVFSQKKTLGDDESASDLSAFVLYIVRPGLRE